jgi:hypothetical protein
MRFWFAMKLRRWPGKAKGPRVLRFGVLTK